MGATSTGSFAHDLMQNVLESIYDGLYEGCEGVYNGLFTYMNKKIDWAATELTTTPQNWNPDAFDLVKNISQNACIPIAGCIVVFIFCWELIRMTQESNRMNNIKPDALLMLFLKTGLCLIACSKSFEIVMGFYEIGAFATSKLSTTINYQLGTSMSIADIMPPVTGDYTFGMIFEMVTYYIVLWIARLVVLICSSVIYIRIMLWFLELLIYASAAPIPYATFGNKEWGQIGMNYTRKMLAVCFEGFFMLLCLGMYGGVVAGVNGSDFMESVFMIIGCGFALIVLLFKTGTISASIFNAH